MRFEVDSKVLQQALQTVSRVVKAKSPMPALSGIRVEAGAGITLTATDLDMYISTVIDGSVKEPGTTVIPAKQFVSLVRQITGSVSISAGDSATLKYGSGSMTLPCFDSDEFPPQDEKVTLSTASISGDIISNIVDYVTPATINDDLMPHLSGVNIRIRDGEILACATDRFRVSRYTASLDGEMECIIPSKALTEASKIGDVKVTLTDTTISFTGKDTAISSRLLAGGIPIDTIMGVFDVKSGATALRVPVNELTSTLNRAMITMDKYDEGVKLTLGDGIVIENVSALGRFSETVPATIDGKQEVYMSPRFLKDALIGDDVDIYFSGPESLVLVKGGEYEMGILPIRML